MDSLEEKKRNHLEEEKKWNHLEEEKWNHLEEEKNGIFFWTWGSTTSPKYGFTKSNMKP